MQKKLTQIGSSWGFLIPRAILELMDIDPEKDKIEFELIKDELTIKKAKNDNNK